LIRTRFAPSPTGDLHFGGAWTALASWALACHERGHVTLRLEDIDAPRIVAGSAARIETDLAWLGLDWDEGPNMDGLHAPYIQSMRATKYEAALEALNARGLIYPCDCSRAEIAREASAPHAGEEVMYPGTCRNLPKNRAFKRPPALRLRVPEGSTVSFVDRIHGRVEQHVDVSVGDFVLRRGDGIYAYQLVVAVDDAAMEITDVVRGADLLGSTARQILLMRMLGTPPEAIPRYTHVPLVVGPTGERLAKRHDHPNTVRELRARGVTPEEIVGTLAFGLGLVENLRSRSATEVARALRPPSSWRRNPWRIPHEWE